MSLDGQLEAAGEKTPDRAPIVRPVGGVVTAAAQIVASPMTDFVVAAGFFAPIAQSHLGDRRDGVVAAFSAALDL